jgi:uroporphyrinogen III methyltransferase/synthase
MTRLLVTRPDGRASGLTRLLRDAGFEVVLLPAVAIEPPGDEDIARVRVAIGDADWVVITSAHGAPTLAAALAGDALPAGARVAAVGPATAEALERVGLPPDAMPSRYRTVAIADALGDVRGKRVVLARADAATADLRETLIARGARVQEVTAYRTVEAPAPSRERVRNAIAGGIDGILFTSGSTVRGLVRLVPPELRARVTAVPAFCIGPVTAEVARKAGFAVAATADEHTAAGLARTTIHHFHEEAS